MTPIAPLITAFLRDRLAIERGASPHTRDTYAYAFKLLFEFAAHKLKLTPSKLCLEQPSHAKRQTRSHQILHAHCGVSNPFCPKTSP
jgi:hypothetical protein